MSGEELLKELLYYGISAITLSITGSERTEGLRACVSLAPLEQLPLLERDCNNLKQSLMNLYLTLKINKYNYKIYEYYKN